MSKKLTASMQEALNIDVHYFTNSGLVVPEQDEILVEQFQDGKAEVFDTLLLRYQNKVMATCLSMLGNSVDAEDAAQEIFVKVYQALPRFKPKAKFSTWLYRISINHCSNVIRSRRIRKYLSLQKPAVERMVDNQGMHQDGTTSARPDTALEQAERDRAVWQAVEMLSYNQKVAVVLNKFAGLSYQEVAEVMEISNSAVESLLHRAKKKLYTYLSKLLEK